MYVKIVKLVSCEQLLTESDILSLHLAHSNDNVFQLGKNEMAKMKKGAILINVARGQFVNEDDLFDALSNGLMDSGVDFVAVDFPQAKH